MINKNRIFSLVLIFSILLGILPAYAAPPTVSVDEAVYGNLDYYGALTDLSIVKGCSMNGNTTIIDFGNYSKVVNMTNYAAPQLTDAGVTWDVGNEVNRFYYECTPKDLNVNLPWSLDINYKLNGQPVKAENLAGVSGYIEIEIKVTPNRYAKDYYKNNMLLQASTMVNMDDVYSIEAEGAQVQSVGTYKAVVFMAVPGEETAFKVGIGTNSFDSKGIIITMLPATLERLRDIKELKENKDKVKDSLDAIYESGNQALTILHEMSLGLGFVKEGASGLNNVRGNINSSKDSVYNNADSALNDLELLIDNISTIVPHIQKGSQLVEDLNKNSNELVDNLVKVKADISKYNNSITKIRNYLKEYIDMVNKLNEQADDRKALFKDLKSNLEELKTDMANMEEDTDSLSRNISYLRKTLKDVEDSIDKMGGIPNVSLPNIMEIAAASGSQIPQSNEMLGALNLFNAYSNGIGSQINTGIAGLNQSLKSAKDTGADVLSDTKFVLRYTAELLNTLKNLSIDSESTIDNLNKALDLSDTYLTILEDHSDTTENTLKELNTTLATMQQSLSNVGKLIDNVSSVNQTLNNYNDDIVELLDDTDTLTTQLNKTLTSTLSLMRLVKSVSQDNGSELNSSTQKTLDGLIDVLDKTIRNISIADTTKNANNIIKKAVDDEISKYEDDTNLLNLDVERPLISFTSDENPNPSSLQVILRTKEIHLDDKKDIGDLEKSQNKSAWARMADVFAKIWGIITGKA